MPMNAATNSTNKQTVLLVRNAFKFDFGGGERLPVDISKELLKYDIKPIVVSRSPKLLAYAAKHHIPHIKSWWWSRQDWSGVRILLTPFYFAWQFILVCWYLQLIRKTRADIVHVQSKDDFIAGTIAGKLLGKRVLWSDYADLKYVYLNNRVWYKNPIGKVVRRLSKYADIVILTSESDKRFIEESLGSAAPDNHKVIHVGVAGTEIPKITRPAADKKAVIFVATSRLVVAKGIGELISAFKKLHHDQPDTRLWLFGEGPDDAQFKAQASGCDDIHFWGFPEDALARAADCDVFVHPSYLEGFSISLIEAAKLGLPIIACNVGGNPELVQDGHNGILIPPRDSESLYQAMQKLAGSPALRKEYGTNARKTYQSDLVFEEIIKDKFVPLYKS